MAQYTPEEERRIQRGSMRGLGAAPGGKELLSNIGSGLTEVAAQSPLGGILNVGVDPQSVQSAGELGQEAFNTFNFMPGVRLGAQAVDFLNEAGDMGNPILARNRERLARAQQTTPISGYQPGQYALSDEQIAEQHRRLDQGLDLDTGLPLSQTRLDSIRQMQQDRAGGVDPIIANDQLSTGQFGENVFDGGQEQGTTQTPVRKSPEQLEAELLERDRQVELQQQSLRDQGQARIQPGSPPAENAEDAEYRLRTESRADYEDDNYFMRTHGRAAEDDWEHWQRTEARAAGIDLDAQQELEPGTVQETQFLSEPRRRMNERNEARRRRQEGIPETAAPDVQVSDTGRASYNLVDPTGSGKTARIGATENPNAPGSYTPAYNAQRSGSEYGEAAMASPRFREDVSGLAAIAISSGMDNPLYEELNKANAALDLDRSNFPSGPGGDTQYNKALQQARRHYGGVAKRVLKTQGDVFKAQATKSRKSSAEDELELDQIISEAQKLRAQDERNDFSRVLSDDQYMQRAMQGIQSRKNTRERAGRIRSGELVPQPQGQRTLPESIAEIQPQQIPQIISRMEQFELPFSLTQTPEGMPVIVSQGVAFPAILHKGSVTPVAVLNDRSQVELARSLGVPYVTSGNLEEVQNPVKPKPKEDQRRVAATGGRKDFGTDALNEETLQIQAIEQAESDFESAYKTIVSEQTGASGLSQRREDYTRLAKSYLEETGEQVDPNVSPVLDKDPGFAAWLEQREIVGDEDSLAIMQRSNIQDGKLPQMAEPSDDPQVARLREILDRQDTRKNRRTGAPPSAASLREEYIRPRVNQIYRESIASRTEQQRILNDVSGRTQQEAVKNAYTQPRNFGNRSEVTLQRTPGVFNPQPVRVRPDGNVEIDSVEQVVNTALGLPFFYQGKQVVLDKQRLEDVTEEIIRRPGQETQGNRKIYDTAVFEVAQVIRDAFPNDFPNNNAGLSRLTEVSKNMLRRLGYLTETDLYNQ